MSTSPLSVLILKNYTFYYIFSRLIDKYVQYQGLDLSGYITIPYEMF